MRDPNWISIGDLLATPAVTPSIFSVVGAPVAKAAVTPGRCDLAPDSIRRSLDRISSYDVSNGFDLSSITIADWGDVAVSDMTPEEANDPLQAAVHRASAHTTGAVAILGGNNSVTRPAFHGVHRRHASLGLITLDAHHDVRETDRGLNNGNPIRALIQDGIKGAHIVQIGIQPFCNSAPHTTYAGKSGIRFFTIDDVRAEGIESLTARALAELTAKCHAIYLDLDLDVMERSAVPSTAGSRPGGLTVAEVLVALRVLGFSRKVVALDIVEHNPERDLNEITAVTAGTCLATFFSAFANAGGR